jgi:hypothetical protein
MASEENKGKRRKEKGERIDKGVPLPGEPAQSEAKGVRGGYCKAPFE